MFIQDRHSVFNTMNKDLIKLNNYLKKTPKDLTDFCDEFSKYMSNQTEIDNLFIKYLSSNEDLDFDKIYFLQEYYNNIPINIQKVNDFSKKLLQFKLKYEYNYLYPIKKIWRDIISHL
jgi:Tfp pilus assembly protein PilO